MAATGIVIERLFLQRLYQLDHLYGLLLTFGAAMVIEEMIRLVWGTRDHVLQVPQAVSGGFLFGDLIWSTYRFYAAGISAGIDCSLHVVRRLLGPETAAATIRYMEYREPTA